MDTPGEKSNDTISKRQVKSITTEDVRVGSPKPVTEKLMGFGKGDVVVLNAAAEEDMEESVAEFTSSGWE